MDDDALDSTLIKIKTLQKEYEVTLTSYEEASKNYILALEKNKKEFTTLKQRSWWGTAGISETKEDTIEACQAKCLNTTNCSGATYNSTDRYCWLRSGDTGVTAGRVDDFAIITTTSLALSTMKTLNDKLISLNDEIAKELASIKVTDQTNEIEETQKKLNNTYLSLIIHKVVSYKQDQLYNSINRDDLDQSLYVSKQSIQNKFWMFVTCIILLVTIKQLVGIPNPPLYITILFIIIILLILLSYTLTTHIGIVIWSSILIAVIIYKSNS
jgi:hypothetical protein